MIYIVYITLIALYLSCILSLVAIYIFAYIFIKEQYESWKCKKYRQKQEKEWEEFIQRQHRRELHKKEMKKYPLFFWKELTNGNT